MKWIFGKNRSNLSHVYNRVKLNERGMHKAYEYQDTKPEYFRSKRILTTFFLTIFNAQRVLGVFANSEYAYRTTLLRSLNIIFSIPHWK